MDEEVKKLRDQIIRKFCRTILWVDDEIDLQKGLGSAKPLFRAKFNEFTDAGLLCHLKEFPPVGEGKDKYVTEEAVTKTIDDSIRLAHQADVVIIDWELGNGTTSIHAQKIVKSLLGADKGFRFVVVLSKKELPHTVFADLGGTFESVGDRGDLLVNKTGQFLLSLCKSDFSGTNLFDRISEAMFLAYPDYLHLAALEVAGRIKDLSPTWLSSIPTNADTGILVERGNTITDPAWNADMQECIATNLIEDLETVVLSKKLDSLKENMLKPSNRLTEDALSGFSTQDEGVKNAVLSLGRCLQDDDPLRFPKSSYEKLSENRNNSKIAAVVGEIEAYTEFCEKRSGSDLIGKRICPGAIYEGLSGVMSEVAVCITAGCDCLRSPSLLFLVGQPMPEIDMSGKKVPDYKALRNGKGGKTVLRIKGKSYVFHGAANAVLVKPREALEHCKVLGVVRQDLLNRLVSRFMSQTQRFAVNQPYLVRKLREEGGLDE